MREHIDYAWQKVADCAARAEETTDRDTREFFVRLRDSWTGVARRYELLETIEHYPAVNERPPPGLPSF